ncbi:MAG: Ada metal-binding domain-containing protein [Halobacteriota archaeon]
MYSTQSTSKVYHYPSCSYVSQIKAENKGTFSSSAEARAAGYHPCSRCNPP